MVPREPSRVVLDVDRLERQMLQRILSEGSSAILAENLGLDRGTVVRSSEEHVAAAISQRLAPSSLASGSGGENATRLVPLTGREANVLQHVLDRLQDRLERGIDEIEDLGKLLRRAMVAGKAERLGDRLRAGMQRPTDLGPT